MNFNSKAIHNLFLPNLCLIAICAMFFSKLTAQSDMSSLSIHKVATDLDRENAWIQVAIQLDEIQSTDTEVYIHYGGNAVQDRDFEGPAKVLIPAGSNRSDFRIENIHGQFLTKASFLTVLILPHPKLTSDANVLKFILNVGDAANKEAVTQ